MKKSDQPANRYPWRSLFMLGVTLIHRILSRHKILFGIKHNFCACLSQHCHYVKLNHGFRLRHKILSV